MKVLVMSLFIMVMNISAYAEDFFMSTEVKDLHVLSVNCDEATAVIEDRDGYEAEISIGDTVGADGATVININKTYITIQLDNTEIRIPVRLGFGKTQSLP